MDFKSFTRARFASFLLASPTEPIQFILILYISSQPFLKTLLSIRAHFPFPLTEGEKGKKEKKERMRAPPPIKTFIYLIQCNGVTGPSLCVTSRSIPRTNVADRSDMYRPAQLLALRLGLCLRSTWRGSDVMSERLTPRYQIGLYQVTSSSRFISLNAVNLYKRPTSFQCIYPQSSITH